MEFTFKKIISGLLLPLPIALIFFLVGLCLLWWTRKKWLTNTCLVTSFLILVIFGFNWLPSNLLNSLENDFQPITILPTNTKNIVVLGGGVRNDTNAPPNTQLSSASLSRLIEGVRLYHLYHKHNKDETLILSGGHVFGKPAAAGIMQNIAVILGVDPKNIILEAGSRDTRDEVHYLKKQLDKKPFILVTSAYHMPRAIALFKEAGLNPIAAPTQYFSDSDRDRIKYYLPSANYLIMSDIALHEYFGRLWAKIRY